MHRRDCLRKCAFSAGAVLAAPMLNFGRCRLFGNPERTYSVRTVDLVGDALVIDMLGLLTLDWSRLRRWHTDPQTFTGGDLQILQASGVHVFHPAVDLNGTDPYGETREWLRNWNRFLQAWADYFTRISGVPDFDQARGDSRIGILLGMQNSDHFRTAADVHEFWRLGQRVSQLTYNGPNRIGHGCIDRADHGLTLFGGEIVQAMNQAGMVIDVSHAGERTTLDAFQASTRPVLVTHSNCKALVPHPRCKSDSVLRAMGRSGGVMGITYVRTFLRRRSEATLDDALDHFDHAARIAGIEHLGIGSDTDLHGYDGVSPESRSEVFGLNHPRRIFDLTEGLLRRRYKSEDIHLILGGNFKRAIAEIFSLKSL